MTKPNKSLFGGDAPKHNPWEEDRLGYGPFAGRIAEVIISTVVPNGYVIGLHGRWGSGKSTVLNFTLSFIKKHNTENEDNKITHVDYRPWIVSGHQDLVAAFFDVLSEELGSKENVWLRQIKRIFGLIDGSTDKLFDAAAAMAKTVDPSGGVASGLVAGILKRIASILSGRINEKPSLQKSYENLKHQLNVSGRRFVVTIDDIDRLEDSEIASIMQMVKSIGQLPNVTYLLAYDRKIVWSALRKTGEVAGPHFAEKIVQQEIELPRPTRNALLGMLDKEISFLTAETSDSVRWQYIVRDGIQRWIKSPRDVVRLSNAVKFSWPVMQDELDAQDLLAVEGLRLFDTDAYEWIRESRDFIFGQGKYTIADKAVHAEAVKDLQRRISDQNRSEVTKILSTLFPQITSHLSTLRFSMSEPEADVKKRRGIGCEAGYDLYFNMSISPDAIPKSVINKIFANLNNFDALCNFMKPYVCKKDTSNRPLLIELLDEMRALFRSQIPPDPTQALLDALFQFGEEALASDWEGNLFELSARAHMGFLIRLLLERWGNSQAGQHLVSAFENATSVAFMSDVYVERGRELRIFDSVSSEGPVISNDDFDALGRILLPKIVEGAENGTLKDAPFYFDIVRSWRHCAATNAAGDWLNAGMLEDADFLYRVGRGLVSYSAGGATREYTMRDEPDQSIYDLSIIAIASQKHLSSTRITNDQRSMFIELNRGSQQIMDRRSQVPKAAN